MLTRAMLTQAHATNSTSWCIAWPVVIHSLLSPPAANCDSEEVSGAHLHANSSQVYPGVAVGFSCDADYVLDGAETITCLSAGLWSHPVPTCTQGMHTLQQSYMVKDTSALGSRTPVH